MPTAPRVGFAKDTEDLLFFQLRALALPEPERQYAYAPPRKFRADFAYPARRLLIEVQGGIWTGKAHGSISGVVKDNERLNVATLAGWRVLRFTPDQVESGEAMETIEKALKP